MTFNEFIKETFNGQMVDLMTVSLIQMGWNAGVEAERDACATAIEELIPLLDPEREPTLRMCAYTCRNKYMPKEKNHVS